MTSFTPPWFYELADRAFIFQKMAAEAGLRGLFLDLKNSDNKSVLTCGFGSSGPHRSAGIHAAQILDMEFMFLKSNEVRKFRHSLSCVPKVPGRYLITAEYRPLDPDTQRVASLPKTKGLVLQEVVVAEPVEISIE